MYASAASWRAAELGHQVVLITHGFYSFRHKRVNRFARKYPDTPMMYIACHLNAGGGNYGLVLHDQRSHLGQQQGQFVVDAMDEHVWQKHRVRNVGLKKTAKNHPQWPRAFATIEGIYKGPNNVAGLCFEPLFIDGHEELMVWDVFDDIGYALAEGFHAWTEEWNS